MSLFRWVLASFRKTWTRSRSRGHWNQRQPVLVVHRAAHDGRIDEGRIEVPRTLPFTRSQVLMAISMTVGRGRRIGEPEVRTARAEHLGNDFLGVFVVLDGENLVAVARRHVGCLAADRVVGVRPAAGVARADAAEDDAAALAGDGIRAWVADRDRKRTGAGLRTRRRSGTARTPARERAKSGHLLEVVFDNGRPVRTEEIVVVAGARVRSPSRWCSRQRSGSTSCWRSTQFQSVQSSIWR